MIRLFRHHKHDLIVYYIEEATKLRMRYLHLASHANRPAKQPNVSLGLLSTANNEYKGYNQPWVNSALE